MRRKLIEERLWDEADGRNPVEDMTCAWSVLAKLGAPYRFAGMAPDGRKEFLILNTKDGSVIASGRGATSEEAMCEAALAARSSGTSAQGSAAHH